LSNAAYSCWTDESIPRKTTLLKIADYFGVTVEDLLRDGEPETVTKQPSDTLYLLDGQDVHMIPLFESVSAGFGSLAVDEIIDYIPAYIPDQTEARETIFIRVHGDSMFPKIEDGDIIQVHKQESVDSGSVAVVILDGEDGLVKRVVYGDTWIELHSFNPLYKTQRFNDRDVLRVRVVGLVQKIIKEV
jgi:repressor LexA